MILRLDSALNEIRIVYGVAFNGRELAPQPTADLQQGSGCLGP